MFLFNSACVIQVLLLVFVSKTKAYLIHHGQERTTNWLNRWIVELEPGHNTEMLADEMGVDFVEELPGFPGHYLVQTSEITEGPYETLTQQLRKDHRVRWAEQQFHKIRVKRGVVDRSEFLLRDLKNLFSLRNLPDQSLEDLLKLKSIPDNILALWKEEEALENTPQVPEQVYDLFNDELWDHEWYLHDTRSRKDTGLPDISLHVVNAWKRGITGSGVKIVVLDDGLDYEHPDLADNYDPAISYDFNSNDNDPMPRSKLHSHGTRCAGEIAMISNNGLCGVGVAYNSTIGGVRVLDGKISDELEGRALSWALDKVDIYSSSWGPDDDGKTVEGPGRLATTALEKGVKEGRNGKGAIYVWASGNGGSKGDNCNCDGYTASIYTVSISSASQQGYSTWYGESCPSTLASTFSSGAYTDQKISTTDVGGGCTVSHTGTSAAAPLAAGIIALALQANPKLTWRDVQYLIVYTSDHHPVKNNPGWKKNGDGLFYNPSFGFGVMNGEKIVSTAMDWINVPKQTSCQISNSVLESHDLRGKHGDVISVNLKVDQDCSIKYLEHVQVTVSISHPKRGNLEVLLKSPQETITKLLATRPKDDSRKGFQSWTFMSVETWGENPKGTWTVYVADRESKDQNNATITENYLWTVDECRLTLRGIETNHKNEKLLSNSETF